MIDTEKNNQVTKRLALLLALVLLLNPVVIYLVSGSVWLGLLVPFFMVVIYFLLKERKGLKPLSTLVFNLAIIISFFLHAEAVFTFRFSDHIIEDLYVLGDRYYFNRPYLDQTFRDKEFVVSYRTNQQGFRIGAEDEADTQVAQADWLFIGDSYTQGAQVQYEELFTSRLFDSFPDKVIVNAGISGLGIADEYHYYLNEGKKLKAKKVFLQLCNFNDFMNVKERRSGFSDYLMHYSNFARFILYDFKFANPTELPLGRWAEPFYPDRKSNEDYNIFYKVQSDQKKQDLKNFEMYLRKFGEAVRENGAELVVLQVPTKEQVGYNYFEEVINNLHIDPAMLDMELPNRLLKNWCLENKIAYLDLHDDFSTSEKALFFEFDEHLNVDGHWQMASSIADFFYRNGVEKTQVEVLSRLNVGDRYPNFSLHRPQMLAYQSFRDGNMELFVSDSLLARPERLTHDKVDQVHPWISPLGDYLLFTEGDAVGDETKVVLMDVQTKAKHYLISDPLTFGAIPTADREWLRVTYPQWHKDPKTGRYSNPYIIVHELATGKVTQLSDDSSEAWRPIFSADGQSVFYISKQHQQQFDIFRCDLSTGKQTNLTRSKFDEWDIAVSPDGKSIAYAANRDGNWDIFIQELASGKVNRLSRSLGNEWDVAFSPDGTYLYYSGTFGLRNGIFRLKLK